MPRPQPSGEQGSSGRPHSLEPGTRSVVGGGSPRPISQKRPPLSLRKSTRLAVPARALCRIGLRGSAHTPRHGELLVAIAWAVLVQSAIQETHLGTCNPKRTNMANMLSVPAFLAEHGISRSLFYRLVKEGRGPRIAKIGGRTLVTTEAAAEWRARMERETEQVPPRSSASEHHRQRTAREKPVSGREAA